MNAKDEDTVEDILAIQSEQQIVAESFEEQELEIAAMTHRGKKRSTNEDQFCVVRRSRSGEVLASSLPADQLSSGEDRSWLLTVADGLGGQVSGEVASATAIRTILEFANRLSNWIMNPVDGLRDDLEERVDLYIRAIQGALQQQAKSNPVLAGMATTITSAYIFGDNATIVNLGDSRSYLIRPDKIYQVTQDHTLEQELKQQGLSSQHARPYRNLVTRCLNTRNEPVHVDLFHISLQAGDYLLLCSDGLTDMVADPVIHHVVMSAPSTKGACEQLMQRALAAGGRDNITIVLARIKQTASSTRQADSGASTS